VVALCGLLGISPQGYYKHKEKESLDAVLISSIVLYCHYIRSPENLPKAGCRELLHFCKMYFAQEFTFGRDCFYDILRANSLMLKRKRYRPRTTDSRHGFRLYPDLLNTSPRFVPDIPGELIVADITYVYCLEGFGYLSLLTDAYSRYIVGYCFHRTLGSEGPVNALNMALSCYRDFHIDISFLIHHSDRGIQYASLPYVKILRSKGIRISMTQTGDPLHNALAERMNNTLKNSWIFNNGKLTFLQASHRIDSAVKVYNMARPHQALGMKTPLALMTENAINPLLKKWR
jgi:putative transposase